MSDGRYAARAYRPSRLSELGDTVEDPYDTAEAREQRLIEYADRARQELPLFVEDRTAMHESRSRTPAGK